MQVTIYRVDQKPETRSLEKKLTLAEMQALVGGYIELMPWVIPGQRKWPKRHRGFTMIADEDGRPKGLPVNIEASTIVGTRSAGRPSSSTTRSHDT